MAEPHHDLAADVGRLRSELDATELSADPDAWALAAYRLAVAESEMARGPAELERCVALLERAGKILTPERAPLENGRILTATGNCLRAAGRSDLAAGSFTRAAELLTNRADLMEQAAALANVGLVKTETGDRAGALSALDRAVDLLESSAGGGGVGADDGGSESGDQRHRALGAALLNRAQARQMAPPPSGGGQPTGQSDLPGALADYRQALGVLPPESPQAGMAWHGMATALLETARRSAGELDDSRFEATGEAIDALHRSLAVFTYHGFPFQHAIARHSLAVAHQLRATASADADGGRLDLAWAVHHGDMALTVFDPRLHRSQWQTVTGTMTELTEALAPQSRYAAVVELLTAVEEAERTSVLRDRLVPLSEWPEARVEADLSRLSAALTELDGSSLVLLLKSYLSVLMELPDRVLAVACRNLVAVNDAATDTEAYDKAIDDAIQARLFGPQRVRVRDLLVASGWERP